MKKIVGLKKKVNYLSVVALLSRCSAGKSMRLTDDAYLINPSAPIF